MRRKVLMISPVPTHPATAGNRARIRVFAQSLLDLGLEVHFVHLIGGATEIPPMQEFWGERYVPVYPTRTIRRGASRVRKLGQKLRIDASYRLGIDDWYDPALDDAIDALSHRVSFDFAVAEYVFMSKALLRFPASVCKVIDTHDVFADRHRRYLDQGEAPTWFSCSRTQENKALNRADVILAIQDQEADDFRSRSKACVEVLGHPSAIRPQSGDAAIPGRILLVGSNNPINLKGFDWFARFVLPEVRDQIHDAELAVAGTVCSKLQESDGIRLLGPVEDLSVAYASAQVVINPMPFGTGLKVKSLEALAHARPLVTTPSGAEGLLNGGNEPFRVAVSASEFAHEVVAFLSNRDRCARYADAGISFLQAYNRGVRECISRIFGTDTIT